MKIAICDDEKKASEALLEILEECPEPIEKTDVYFSGEELLRSTEQYDLLFLDIDMEGIDGIETARKIRLKDKKVKIVYVTAYSEYAGKAFSVHAFGYLLKPVDSGDLKRELTFLYGDTPASRPIQVHTFGGFEVCVNGKPLVFNRAKSKELLACLIDRRGAGLTTREACSLLWEDGVYNIARKNYFQTIVHDLRNTLSQAGIASILVKHRNSISIRADMIDCDSYRFLDGDPRAINSYRHTYLPSYSWAEFSVGKMERL